MTLLFILIIAFSFFIQSTMGFGGGLIAVPLLSLFMPVQDVVTLLIIFSFSMGLLIFKTHSQISWRQIRSMIPAVIIGVILGLTLLKYMPDDIMRLILAAYIIGHLLRTHTSFDPLKALIQTGGASLAGFLGGTFTAMISTGGPAFILYLKDKAPSSGELRANIIAILFISTVPRLIGAVGSGMMTPDLFMLSLSAMPGFLLALSLGQLLHNKIPQEFFFKLIDVILVCAALSLLLKVMQSSL